MSVVESTAKPVLSAQMRTSRNVCSSFGSGPMATACQTFTNVQSRIVWWSGARRGFIFARTVHG